MDRVLSVCISDGSEIVIDGFDEISFYNEISTKEVSNSGYSWQRDFYHDLLNNLSKFNFISIKRSDAAHKLEYRNHAYAFHNQNFSENKPIYLQTNCITTIIDMYN